MRLPVTIRCTVATATALVGLSSPSLAGPPPSLAGMAVSEAPRTTGSATKPLTNLAHLDWLGVTVTPPSQEGHTTYRLGAEPSIGTLWTYAEPEESGGYRHVGGGEYDPATNTWGQGAYNADDMTRAAVVYLRHWRATGDLSSRDSAYDMLRGVTYLQTSTGPNAGNVVLWMQPDGMLNPSAEPVELPDPSDSAESYWLARTIWALGEGYAAFRDEDPAFASFLAKRLKLAIGAVDRQVLDRYGEYLNIDGQRTPAWLIVDGADATAEAILGLSAYVSAGGPRHARTVLLKLTRGVAALGDGDAQTWPFGAVRPWALSRSVFHTWGSQMPAALAEASAVLGKAHLARPALTDSFTFDPWLLTSGGPDQGRLPTRGDASQIAYGVDSRIQSLLATSKATGRSAGRRIAGMFAAWYFGANAAGEAMYKPATGRTFDGVSAEGDINRNSGAESTIHGLLSMIALDENPKVAALAHTAVIDRRRGSRTLQAEDAALSGDARVVNPADLWTGESLYSGSGYVELRSGGSVSFALTPTRRRLVMPVFNLEPGSSAVTTFHAQHRTIGEIASSRIGRQGDSPAPGALLPVTLQQMLPKNTTRLTATAHHAKANPAILDAIMLQPRVSRFVLSGRGHGTALLSNSTDAAQLTRVNVGGRGRARVASYNGNGLLVRVHFDRAERIQVTVPASGFTLIRR